MKKVVSDLFHSKKNAYLSKVFAAVLLAVFYLHYKLAFILEPSSFDMILELTTLKLAPFLKSSIVLSNYRPQLGDLTFLITGGAAKTFGIIGGYVIRYVLFVLNIVVFFHVFKEYLEDKKLNYKNSIFFLMTSGLTFFAMIKYFYVVDFLTALLFSFISLLVILQNRSKMTAFVCVVIAIYFKFSILIFLFPLLVIGQRNHKELFKYVMPISLATALGLGMFFMKSVDHVLGQRGLFTILSHEGILNFIAVNIFAPWEFFKFFDQSVANYSLQWSPYIIIKLVLILVLASMIFIKNKLNAIVDFLCVLASLIGIIAIQPHDPWFHDISFYVGMIGLLAMVMAWKYKTIIFGRNLSIVVIALFLGDFYYWNQSIKSVGLVTTKLELQDSIKREVAMNNVTDLYLYCMNNIGEFEWNLRGNQNLKIHYVLDAQDLQGNLNRPVTSKSLWLFPKKCLHENPPQSIGNDPSMSASFKREFYLNSMEYYRLYSNY
ncbi:hypothetical protein SHI21_10880 [Bacteriovorax sp. PP10]|uniref:Glycosyltransferase RgtA/B/C/D-like domain-containing protein n=1 Tax=Bacteriovorax antarcticus TaxID=3088717 RepID=A0ABU5VUH0_9BACT|nr:hypothetical protein [Bacteriovorax sp. PP10]MEA9356713.1 hypothetical protein [Bacteriovorax sp. PP10]